MKLTAEQIKRRIEDLDALHDFRTLSLIWHGLVDPPYPPPARRRPPKRDDERQRLAETLHSAVGSVGLVARDPELRVKLLELVTKALRRLDE